MPPREIDQFTVELRGCQCHDRAGGIKLHRAQGSVEPHGCILEDVIRIFPAANAGVAAKHPVGQAAEAVGAEFDDPIAGGEVSPGELLQAGIEGR